MFRCFFLEILFESLIVSIFEILKGKKIKNEIIQIIEANDYVKNSRIFKIK